MRKHANDSSTRAVNIRYEEELESAEFSVVSNLLLTRVAGGTRRQQPFYHPLGDFLADSSNFGTIAKFALTPEAMQNIGNPASGSVEKATLSRKNAIDTIREKPKAPGWPYSARDSQVENWRRLQSLSLGSTPQLVCDSTKPPVCILAS